jgi:hypothetical protein
MANEVISYNEMCRREAQSLQRGMNFGVNSTHSVILMSVRPNAPYRDRFEDDGATLIYEGHDHLKMPGVQVKEIDQPEFLGSGNPTQNGQFRRAALQHKEGHRPPERVRVYEKIKTGIWSYNGIFHLVDAWTEHDGRRNVFKFKLVAVEGEEDFSVATSREPEHRRLIPTPVKLEVWRRDNGRCVKCGANDNLHFDHDLPYAKGGTSLTAANVQLLCMRHNLEKSDHIA